MAHDLPAPGARRCGRVSRAHAGRRGRGDYTPNVRLRLEMGRYVLAEDYVRALSAARPAHARASTRRSSDVDALVLPALAIPAPPIGAATVPREGRPATPVRTADAALHAAVQPVRVTRRSRSRAARRARACRSACNWSGSQGRHDPALVQPALGVRSTARDARMIERSSIAGNSGSPTSVAHERVVRPFEWGVDWMPDDARGRRTARTRRARSPRAGWTR